MNSMAFSWFSEIEKFELLYSWLQQDSQYLEWKVVWMNYVNEMHVGLRTIIFKTIILQKSHIVKNC